MNWLRSLLPKSQVASAMAFPAQKLAAQNSISVCTTLQELIDLQIAVTGKTQWNAKQSEFHRLGNQRSNRRGHGIEFSDVRTYAPGDDTRHIDWRLTARCSNAMTRLYSEERDQPLYVLIDQRDSLYFGSGNLFKSVLAARLAALQAWRCHALRIQFGGILLSASLQKIKITHSRQSIVAWLNALAETNERLHTSHRANDSNARKQEACLSEALKQCAANTPAGAQVLVISDFHDFDVAAQARLATLAKTRSVSLYQVVDPVETNLEVSGTVGISNGYQNQTVRMTPVLSQQYRDARVTKDELLQKSAANLRCPLTQVSTQDPSLLAAMANQAA